jgi:hypothetical protein
MIYYYLRNLLFLTFQMANTFSGGENHIWAKKKIWGENHKSYCCNDKAKYWNIFIYFVLNRTSIIPVFMHGR